MFFLGIIDHVLAGTANSYCASGSFGWGWGSQVFSSGSNSSGLGGWSSFQSGDVAFFQRSEKQLDMVLKRDGLNTSFTISLGALAAASFRIHANLYATGTTVSFCTPRKDEIDQTFGAQ